jgi:type IV pilus assembly protein PilO
MFNNLSNREKFLLLLVFLIALGAVYYFYFYTPLTEEIAQLEQERDQKDNRLQVAIGFAEQLPDIKEEYRQIVLEIEARGEYVDKDLIDLLIEFREAAKDNDLELRLYRPTENEENISMTVNIEGGFREIVNLLEDFKEWNYWFEFRDVNISRSDDGVSIYMNTFYHDRLVDVELLNKGVETDD